MLQVASSWWNIRFFLPYNSRFLISAFSQNTMLSWRSLCVFFMVESRVGRLVWRARLWSGQCVFSALRRHPTDLTDPLKYQSNTLTTKCVLVTALRKLWRRSWSETDFGQTIWYEAPFPSPSLASILWGPSYFTASFEGGGPHCFFEDLCNHQIIKVKMVSA